MRSKKVVCYIYIWLISMTISFVECAPNSNCVDKSTCPLISKNLNEIFEREISDFCRKSHDNQQNCCASCSIRAGYSENVSSLADYCTNTRGPNFYDLDCHKFVNCWEDNHELKAYLQSCYPDYLVFDPISGQCKWEWENGMTERCHNDNHSKPVNCQWALWSDWSQCSESCGNNGFQLREREIIQEAKNGGMECQGEKLDNQPCNIKPCPINCQWASWSSWGQCSKTCGYGSKTRTRGITQDAMNGGEICHGNKTEVEECNIKQCPINCQWKSWSIWSQCSKTCGSGSKTRTREKSQDALYGGEDCQGTNIEVEECNIKQCPIDCQWSNWNNWSPCSKSCGTGIRKRTREVLEEALFGGAECQIGLSYEYSIEQLDQSYEIEKCHLGECPSSSTTATASITTTSSLTTTSSATASSSTTSSWTTSKPRQPRIFNRFTVSGKLIQEDKNSTDELLLPHKISIHWFNFFEQGLLRHKPNDDGWELNGGKSKIIGTNFSVAMEMDQSEFDKNITFHSNKDETLVGILAKNKFAMGFLECDNENVKDFDYAVFYRNGELSFEFYSTLLFPGINSWDECDWTSGIPQGFSCARRVMAKIECPDDKFVPVDCSTIRLKID